MSNQDSNRRTVTAADVRAVRFPLVRKGGYDPREVDPFLEVIAQTLEGGPLADPNIDARHIHAISFGTVRRSGYDPAKVDAFLDTVIDTIDPMSGGPAATPVPTERVKPVTQHLPARARRDAEPANQPARARPEPAAASTHEDAVTAPSSNGTVDHDSADRAPLSPIEEGQAHLDRLRVLHSIGVLSDKEVAVIAQRVKKRAKQQLEASEAAGDTSANSVA